MGLFDNTPPTPYNAVREVIHKYLGSYPRELFNDFDPIPIASAIMDQVYTAKEVRMGRNLAVKFQNLGLRETRWGWGWGDIIALSKSVRIIELTFLDDFR